MLILLAQEFVSLNQPFVPAVFGKIPLAHERGTGNVPRALKAPGGHNVIAGIFDGIKAWNKAGDV